MSAPPGRTGLFLCLVFAFLWFACFIVAALPGGKLSAAAGGLQALFLIAFVVVHGALSNGWRGFAVFFVITVGIAAVLEANSIAHGFPFGFYVHHMPGPKPFGVPPAVALGYAILGWPAWSLGKLITRRHPDDAGGINRFVTPVAAAFIITGYDFSYDPIGSTVLQMWTYRFPGGYFGVPLSNFLGWLFTSWVFFQAFALLERRFPGQAGVTGTRLFWLLPCFIWGGMALQYPIKFLSAPAGMAAAGASRFPVADIYAAGVVAALMTMVFVALLAASHAWAVKTRGPA